MTRFLWGLTALFGLAVAGAAAISPTTLLIGSGGWVMAAEIVYVLVLVATLWLDITPPEISSRPSGSAGFGIVLTGLMLAFVVLFSVGSFTHPWLMLALTAGAAGAWFIIAERSSITPLAVIVALAAGALCFGLEAVSGRISFNQIVYLSLVPVMMLGGWLAARRTGLTQVASMEGNWISVLKQIGIGLTLALPPALLNISAGAHQGDSWVTTPWLSLTALTPGIAEEAMARLAILSVSFLLLAGRRGGSSKTALAVAILIAAFAHGLAHVPVSLLFGPAGGTMILASLLFGVPMGLVFVRFGFEAAVAYHFFIDFVRFLTAYLVG